MIEKVREGFYRVILVHPKDSKYNMTMDFSFQEDASFKVWEPYLNNIDAMFRPRYEPS